MKTLLLILALSFVGCSTISQVDNSKLSTAQNTSTQKFEQIKAENVLGAFKNAKLPVTNEIIYTEETDTNHLLNRPNQYIGKINFDDKRSDNTTGANSIEVFGNAEDLEKRKTYTETISKSASMFAQYIYSHKNILLRLDHELTPSQAKDYETVLKSL